MYYKKMIPYTDYRLNLILRILIFIFNRQNRILKINDISPDCLLPGMKIKVPKRNEI